MRPALLTEPPSSTTWEASGCGPGSGTGQRQLALLMARGHYRDEPFGGDVGMRCEHSVLGRERRARCLLTSGRPWGSSDESQLRCPSGVGSRARSTWATSSSSSGSS